MQHDAPRPTRPVLVSNQDQTEVYVLATISDPAQAVRRLRSQAREDSPAAKTPVSGWLRGFAHVEFTVAATLPPEAPKQEIDAAKTALVALLRNCEGVTVLNARDGVRGKLSTESCQRMRKPRPEKQRGPVRDKLTGKVSALPGDGAGAFSPSSSRTARATRR
jgi:hypothetical protein